MVFDQLAKIDTAASELDSFSREYEPLHRSVRQQQLEMRKLNKDIEALREDIKRIEFSDQPDTYQIEKLNTVIEKLSAQHDVLAGQIPQQWSEQRQRFLELTKQEKVARNQYRRLVDDSYQVIVDTREMIAGGAVLADMKPGIQRLHDIIREQSVDSAMAEIKAIESGLSSVKNAHPVKSPLSRARRALKRSQDRDKAIGEWMSAMQQLDAEIKWRQQAAVQLMPGLIALDEGIRDTIGLRLQPRLSQDRAEQVAACLAHHKNISLAF